MKRVLSLVITVLFLFSITVLPVSAVVESTTISQLNASINPTTRVVTISGVLSTGAGKQVSIRVIDPIGNDDFLYQAVSGSNGAFTVTYSTSNEESGTFTVKTSAHGMTAPVQTAFTYTASVQTSVPTAPPVKTPSSDTSTIPSTPSVTTAPANTPVIIDIGTDNTKATPQPSGSKPEVTEQPGGNIPSLSDYEDAANHWAKNFIKTLLEQRILAGYDDGTIRPDKEISRVETVALVAKAIGLPKAENPKFDFVDSKSIPSWAAGYVKTAVGKGIVKGYPDKTFQPNKKITRAEMVAIVCNAFNLGKSTNEIHNFTDKKSIEPWSKGYITKAFELELVKGYQDNSFKPNKNIKRAEAFVIISNCINLNK